MMWRKRARKRALIRKAEENASSNTKEAPPIPSSRACAWCFHLCCILSIAWIILLVLNLVIVRRAEFQAIYSSSIPWSVAWFKGARADKGDDGNVSHVARSEEEETNATTIGTLVPVDEQAAPRDHLGVRKNEKQLYLLSRAPLISGKRKCSSSLHEPLLHLACPRYLPRSNGICYKVKQKKDALKGVYDSSKVVDGDGVDDVFDKENKEGEPQVSAHADEQETMQHGDDENALQNVNATIGSLVVTEVTKEALNKIREVNLSKLRVRMEPGDGPYNYASASKGAKILASNKEAKGSSNILNQDKDKYLRTPCSNKNKYVDMELSEETLIISIVIANHEFYSSNVRELELLGSSIYPTENWTFLGKFHAENARVSQTFTLSEPHWVRYLRIRMLSHYGSEFYCTLSVLEVYGIDAIEWLLEDWIAEEEGSSGRVPPPLSTSHNEEIHSVGEKDSSTAEAEDMLAEIIREPELSNSQDASKIGKAQPVYRQTGRPAVDAIMKLLMQKVRSLEHHQPVVSQYIRDLNDRYNEVLRGYKKDLTLVSSVLDHAVVEISNLSAQLLTMEQKWREDKYTLETNLSRHMVLWNADLRLLRNRLHWVENKEMVALAVMLVVLLIIVMMQAFGMCISLCKMFNKDKENVLVCNQSLWVVPFLGCVLVVFILSM